MTVITKQHKETARKLLVQLTLDEKIGMIHGAGLFRTEGVPRLGIPPFRTDDGPMGPREELHNDNWAPLWQTRDYVTYLPSGSALASTWNPAMATKLGNVLGAEARGRGKDMILAPSINIKRSPLCGRNFEYMSEDPLLTARMAVPEIQAIQQWDVSACPKHFAANSQETDRLEVDETISQRALQELYLHAFKAALQEGGALGLMGAYNLVNGKQCCESDELLDDIVRDDWGYDGIIISDWSAVKRTKASADVSLDIEMGVSPEFDKYYFAQPLKQAIESGEVEESKVDEKVFHILCVMAALRMLDNPEAQKSVAAVSDDVDSAASPTAFSGSKVPSETDEMGLSTQYGTGFAHTMGRKSGEYATLAHAQDALEVAQQSIVLLKNDDKVLPLNKHSMRRLLVVGANADRIHSNGGGSAVIKALHEVTPLLGLNGQLGGNVHIEYVKGYVAKQVSQDEAWQAESLVNSKQEQAVIDEESLRLRDEAVTLAKQYASQGDPVVFVGGLDHLYDMEGRDRTSLDLPYGQNELIEALLEAAPNTVITLVAGSPVTMPWAARAKAIVWNWYNGCESGTALAQVLLGDINPSGHLPESFPLALADSPAHSVGTFGEGLHVSYAEDIFVGYRYYETQEKPVLFPFGHGLSYSAFDYSDLDVRVVDDRIRVTFAIENTGTRSARAVPQVYVGLQETGEDRPVKELADFTSVELEAGERKQITLWLDDAQALQYWSNSKRGWAQAHAAHVYVGESVQDIRLVQENVRVAE